MLRILISPFLLCLGLVVTDAQAQSASGGERQFAVLAGGEANWLDLAYQPTVTKIVPLTFSAQCRSELLKASGDTLVFTRERRDPATGKSIRVAVARATWPAGVRTALLVFVPRSAPAKDGIEFDVLAVDDGFETFPVNSVRVLNLTPAVLLGRIGERDAEFRPGMSPLVSMADVVPKGAPAVAFALGVRLETGPAVLYLGPLEARPQARALVVVLPPKMASSRKVRVSTIIQGAPITALAGK